ncbi:MAG: flagellar basal-body rod protein FlgF [Clostridia bacterium]
MMRSLFSGVSGLRNHQIKMDVVANNISNVNTTGFKSGRATFAEMFSQSLAGASAPEEDGAGGTNPMQIGLGSSVAAIDTLQGQGSLQTTGNDADMAIEGEGFFILGDGEGELYTRAGLFQPDAEGYLVDSNGRSVQGWMADDGDLPVTDASALESVRIPLGETIGAEATTQVIYSNNLNSDAEVGDTWSTPVEIFDSKGSKHAISVSFEKTATNTWEWGVTGEDFDPADIDQPADTEISFDDDGIMQSGGTPDPVVFEGIDGAADIEVNLDFSSITQFSGSSTVSATERNGAPKGSLENYMVDSSGMITGVYSNGREQTIAQIGLAAFANPGGLTNVGENAFRESNNSGIRQVGPAGSAGRGDIAPGTIEMSNVDLSAEFTEMIITQRGFQANSKIVTASDEMLQELVNLKR